MKQFLLVFFSVILMQGVFAQDVKKVKDALAANKLTEAKSLIDQILGNPKNQKNAEAWYLKGKTYSAIANNATERANVPDARMTALDAFKKSMELDKNSATLYLTVDNYQPVFVLYTSGFEEGAGQYNAEKYTEALGTFKNTSTIGDYIFSQGWGLYKLDTTITYYCALAAMNSKNQADAINYFAKLADANVGGERNPEYVTPYRFLAKHYYDAKDEANMMKYISAGKKLYPKDDYLPLLELDYVREKGDKTALFAKYDEILAVSPDNFDVTIDYATELFAETHVTEAAKRPADFDQRCVKIESLYKKAIELKPDSYEAKLSLGKHYYNIMLIKDDEASKIRGTKPEDVKKKSELAAEIVAQADKAIPYLEDVFKHYDSMGKLKVSEKSNFKSACSLLSYSYGKKKDTAKVTFYEKKYDEADKAHQ
jgi:tetratricopeptide (TPR) repeat protein